MTESLNRLGAVSRQYQQAAQAYEGVLVAAAEAEAMHKSARARRILRAMADGANSHAKAETIAEADAEVAALYHHRLIAQAKSEAARAQLHQLREQVQNGRTFAATEREVDRMHAEGQGGAS
jgi:hypothetical protein